MIVYFSVLLFISIVCLFPSNKAVNFRLTLSIFAIFVMMALREDWGGDYDNYKAMFDGVNALPLDQLFSSYEGHETGYLLLNNIVPSFRWVIALTSLIFCSGLYIFFKEVIPRQYWILGFVILFLDRSMLIGNISGIRNSIAVSAFIWGLYFLLKHKRLWYVAVLIAASFFHRSALWLIPFVFVRPKRAQFNLIFVIGAFLIYYLLSIITPESWFAVTDVVFSNVDAFSKYQYYMNETAVGDGTRGLSLIMIFYMLILNLIALKSNNHTPNEYLYLKFSLIWFVIMLSPAFGLTSRLYFYTDYLMLAAAIAVISRSDNLVIRAGYIVCLLAYFGLQFYQFINTEWFVIKWSIYNSCI